MKCPVCVEAGERSNVYVGMGTVTLAYYPPFYDEDGKLHTHDANTATTDYTCSNGHAFSVTSFGSCFTCGWSGGKDVVTVKEQPKDNTLDMMNAIADKENRGEIFIRALSATDLVWAEALAMDEDENGDIG